jgi:hypothetical protein
MIGGAMRTRTRLRRCGLDAPVARDSSRQGRTNNKNPTITVRASSASFC